MELLALLFVIALLVWAGRRAHLGRRREQVDDRAEVSFDSALAANLDDIRQTIREEAKRSNQPALDEISSIESHISEAYERANRFGVPGALSCLLLELDDAAHMPQRSQLAVRTVKGLSYVSGKADGYSLEHVIEFANVKYRLSLMDQHLVNRSKLANVVLEVYRECSWCMIFRGSGRYDLDVDSEWNISASFLEVGEWIGHIVALQELFKSKRDRYWLEYKLNSARRE